MDQTLRRQIGAEVGSRAPPAPRGLRGAFFGVRQGPATQRTRRHVQTSPEADAGPFLKLDGISKRFGKFEALKGIALAVNRG